jgi:hypothetical protein
MASRNLSSLLQNGKLPSLLGRAAAMGRIRTFPKISSATMNWGQLLTEDKFENEVLSCIKKLAQS